MRMLVNLFHYLWKSRFVNQFMKFPSVAIIHNFQINFVSSDIEKKAGSWLSFVNEEHIYIYMCVSTFYFKSTFHWQVSVESESTLYAWQSGLRGNRLSILLRVVRYRREKVRNSLNRCQWLIPEFFDPKRKASRNVTSHYYLLLLLSFRKIIII